MGERKESFVSNPMCLVLCVQDSIYRDGPRALLQKHILKVITMK